MADPEAQLITQRHLKFQLMRPLSQLKENLPNMSTSLQRRTLAVDMDEGMDEGVDVGVDVAVNGVKDVANLLKIEMLVSQLICGKGI